MHTQWTQIQEQFERLMDLPTEQQLSALEKLALSQPEIVDELKSLLSIDQRPHNLMEEGIKLALSPDTRIGDQSGPYRIQTHLGSGGMGSVYQAERVEGEFQQQVALKVVQKGLLSDQLLPQFQAERQILARLQHPHIARLYDGGISETGEPYFTMELVDGLPLTDYAGQQQLDEKGKLRLFLQVCEAMQYAHRQLIVHLDLKPGNMLVDANGQVKLLDFGVSRLV
ncbi:MAG: serine/threonine-protein kinase, partial [Bacteroidota bacterium]